MFNVHLIFRKMGVCIFLKQIVSVIIMGKSCKVVVCGQWAVGKTAVLEQLLYANHVAGK